MKGTNGRNSCDQVLYQSEEPSSGKRASCLYRDDHASCCTASDVGASRALESCLDGHQLKHRPATSRILMRVSPSNCRMISINNSNVFLLCMLE
ncbi:hypothetical protein BDV96DRAFT_242976 [Lophiotrema nucula]|uniref:Uncharacterized protein n=1 Tax=Lophiotrema nucula TaxID=690887 RepID=A0A6A5YS25_9PLEO|nr:hypothetical protein BDV96DRAFT_242976 [Lophiotrema nucula]